MSFVFFDAVPEEPIAVHFWWAQALAAAVRRGEPGSDDDDRFDSNCITPGTAFMARLGAHLRFFIRKKMAEDPVWQRPRVVFSGERVKSVHSVVSSILLLSSQSRG